jgi:hypothetical protein
MSALRCGEDLLSEGVWNVHASLDLRVYVEICVKLARVAVQIGRWGAAKFA